MTKEYRERFKISSYGKKKLVTGDLCGNIKWKSNYEYVVCGEVHLVERSTLIIEPGTTISFMPYELKYKRTNGLDYSALVIDSGSNIKAYDVTFKALDNGIQMNGGLIICGSNIDGTYKDIASVTSVKSCLCKRSFLKKIRFSNLGVFDNINSLTLFNMHPEEIYLENITIIDSGNNSIEIIGSDIKINTLMISNGLLTSIELHKNSKLEVSNYLFIRKLGNIGSLLEIYDSSKLIIKENTKIFLDGNKDSISGVSNNGNFIQLLDHTFNNGSNKGNIIQIHGKNTIDVKLLKGI